MSTHDAPYAGDVTPEEAWAVLSSEDGAALVDVRTSAEWAFVGTPDLSSLSKRPLLRQWQVYPSMQIDGGFVAEVTAALGGPNSDRAVYFLCRSGVRSQAAAAAMSAEGWTRCFNILGGFEGPLDADRHRGGAAGWKADGLPWVQS